MAAARTRTSCFSRNVSTAAASLGPGLKCGPNGMFFLSSGIPDLDKILGGGFPLGSVVMVMEDAEAPHHMLLLRNFMAQGLVHGQPLLYASPAKDPKGFLGTLPSPAVSKYHKLREPDPDQEKGMRIAWQYKKYFGENQLNFDGQRDGKHEYSNEFDLRNPLERHFISGQHVDCVSIQDSPDLSTLRDRCATFLSQFPRNDGSISCVGRIAIQSFCAPQCAYSNMEWDMLLFIRSLKSMDNASSLKAQLDQQKGVVENLVSNTRLLESKIQEAKAKKDTLKARAQTARTATKVNEMVGNVNTSSALSAFEKMEEKVMAMESEAEALGQLTTDDLEGKFALLESTSVDDDLANLKKELSGSSQKGELPPGRTVSPGTSTPFPYRDAEIETELNELRQRAKDL